MIETAIRPCSIGRDVPRVDSQSRLACGSFCLARFEPDRAGRESALIFAQAVSGPRESARDICHVGGEIPHVPPLRGPTRSLLAPTKAKADTVRRVSHTLEIMASSPDRSLGLFVANPEMPRDTVHHDPLRRVGARLPFGAPYGRQSQQTGSPILLGFFNSHNSDC
jgi:hypothetical protein